MNPFGHDLLHPFSGGNPMEAVLSLQTLRVPSGIDTLAETNGCGGTSGCNTNGCDATSGCNTNGCEATSGCNTNGCDLTSACNTNGCAMT